MSEINSIHLTSGSRAVPASRRAANRAESFDAPWPADPVAEAGFRRSGVVARLWGSSADYGPERLDWWTEGGGPSSLYGADLF